MINRKNRDVKFIIYQSLYIFVISVLALKGANLDLTKVEKQQEQKQITQDYSDSLRKVIDTLLAHGIVPDLRIDTSKRFTDIEELKKEIQKKQLEITELKSSPSFTVVQTAPGIQSSVVQKNFEQEKKPESTEQKEKKPEIEFNVPQSFTQFTTSSVTNHGDEPIEIYGSDGSKVATIPAYGSNSFTLGGQTSLTFKRGGVSKTVSTRENAKPRLTLQRLVESGENASIRKIQSTVGYRLTITDDFPQQLKVNFNGPVTAKKVADNVYDITLNCFSSKDSYDRYTEGKDSPYSVSFSVVVKDIIATQQTVSQTGVFTFGEW